jgi:hypothetical protein
MNFEDAALLVRNGGRNRGAAAGFVLEVGPQSINRIGLECRHGNEALSASLRIDGVLENEMFGFSSGFPAEADDAEGDTRQPITIDPAPPFQELVRVLAVDPQPDAAVQVLAVELYANGLVVHYQYDDPAAVATAGGYLAPSVSLTDDTGTLYRQAGAEIAGLHVWRGSTRFTPAVPNAAKELRVAIYPGEVRLDLTGDRSP